MPSHCLITWPWLRYHMTNHCSQLLLSSMYMQFPLSCHITRVAMPHDRSLFSATIVLNVYAIPIVLPLCQGCYAIWETIVLSYYCLLCICNSHFLAIWPGLLCYMTYHCSHILFSSMYMQFPLSYHMAWVAMPYERPLFSATIVLNVYTISVVLPHSQGCYATWQIIVLSYSVYDIPIVCFSNAALFAMSATCQFTDNVIWQIIGSKTMRDDNAKWQSMGDHSHLNMADNEHWERQCCLTVVIITTPRRPPPLHYNYKNNGKIVIHSISGS